MTKYVQQSHASKTATFCKAQMTCGSPKQTGTPMLWVKTGGDNQKLSLREFFYFCNDKKQFHSLFQDLTWWYSCGLSAEFSIIV